MATTHLFRRKYCWDETAINQVAADILKMEPAPSRIYSGYLSASGKFTWTIVPVPLQHGVKQFSHFSDLEFRPWVDLQSDSGVIDLAKQTTEIAVGDCTFIVVTDIQDFTKAVNPRLAPYRGNVLVLVEREKDLIEAQMDQASLVSEIIREAATAAVKQGQTLARK